MIRICQLSGLTIAFLSLAYAAISTAEVLTVGSVMTSPAIQISAPEKAVLIDISRADNRLVAVGERGLIVVSDNNGQSWRQVPVPVSVTLTAVQFVDAQHGWAVGHSGTVLSTIDSGENWKVLLDGVQAAKVELRAAQFEQSSSTDPDAAGARLLSAEQSVADGADKPFLAVNFLDAKRGLIVGAFGMAFTTQDGGASWQSLAGHIENPGLVHLYAIARKGNVWLLAGEQGYLARSIDNGQSFTQLVSPYEGSFFTAAVRNDGAFLLAGLNGHAYLSSDEGESFHEMSVSSPTSFSASDRLVDGTVLLANQAGGLFSNAVSSGETLHALGNSLGKPVSGLIEAADGTLIVAGFAGLSRLAHPANLGSE